MPSAARWLLFALPAIALFATAMSGEVYNATSPPAFGSHVVLRKLYSVIAFALVGAAYAYARRGAGARETAVAIALYSGAIEIGQWFVTDEPLEWNLIDLACGGIGGALGAATLSRLGAGRAR